MQTTTSLQPELYALLSLSPSFKIVSVILRNGPNGWHALDSDGHMPIGVSGVSEDSVSVTVHFSFTAELVLGFTTSVDEFFSYNDHLVGGASVGYQTAYLQFGKPGVSGPVNPSTLSSSGNVQFIGLFQ